MREKTAVPLADRFARLREHALSHCPAAGDKSGGPACTLIFSISDGDRRAEVRHAAAQSFDNAWDAGQRLTRVLMKRKRLAGKHLRVDWVERAEKITWTELQKRVASVKRAYFRFGVAFDDKFTHLLTEQECNANAVFYQGSDRNEGAVNPVNLNHYLKMRFSPPPPLPDSAEQPVWQLETAGVYCGPDGKTHHLPGLLPVKYDATTRGIYTGRRDVGRLTPEMLKDVVTRGSRWLARQIQPSGKFVYGYFPCFGRLIQTYNSLRHASSLYSLLDVLPFTEDDSLLAPIRRCLHYLAETLVREYEIAPGQRVAFLVDDARNEIKLGANGVALLAFAAWWELTGSDEFHPLMKLLANGIRHMQNPDNGSFVHVLHSGNLGLKEAFRIIYYDGEAVFGLLRFYRQSGDKEQLRTAQKAFDFFLSSADHRKAHDHWLSYGANEICGHIPDERYFAFGINNFLGHLDFILQRETTYPTLLELMMAAQKMLVMLEKFPHLHHLTAGVDMEKFKRAMHFRAHYLLNGFFWPETAMFFKRPDTVMDAWFIRHHAFRTRIDDAEHYLSGLSAYGALLASGDGEWSAPENARLLGTRFSPRP
ncbi:MAG: hypothetical protein LBR94_01950 [Desulfovibrio sp.]|jgi:hypothetical protein|nr:hypothetical protein [Desulfovibrio sp.]